MHSLFLQAGLIILVLVTLLWLWSVVIKDVSIVDIFWGLGFVIISTFYFLNSNDPTERQILVLILVAVWGIRLTGYLAWRNFGKGEDYRYREFRQRFGAERYWWFSYFQVFLVVWSVGFIFEAGGDYKMDRFKRNTDNLGKVLDSGFWKYTRHPNYFGDATIWVAYGLFCIASGSYWPVIGTVIMILLLLNVSGVALLEKKLKTSKPAYKEYIEKTNAFFPWFPKK